MPKIVFTGGGTAGHIFPILSIVREIRRLQPSPQLKIYYIGPKGGYALSLLRQEGVEIKSITTGKLRRYFSLKNILDLFKLPLGCCQALWWLFFKAPDFIFSKGGYGSFPALISAKILQIPIFAHESDSEPGLVSKITARWAMEVFTSFPKTDLPKEKSVLVGNPVRREILEGTVEAAKELFQLKGSKPLVLILGGSQGSQRINNLVLEILPEMLEEIELIHQTGKNHYQTVKSEAAAILNEEAQNLYHPIPFLNETELRHALAGALLVVSRAGAGTLFEIAASAKASILIPLPESAQKHQIKNAYQFAQQKAAEVLLEENLKPHFFLAKIRHYLEKPELRKQMGLNAQGLANPKAGQIIATYLLEYIYQITKK